MPDAGPVAVPAQRWHPWVRALHWLGVLMVLAVASIGLVMVDLERGSDLRKVCYALHKSLGITALALAALRLLLRLATRAPAPLPAPPWQQRLAQASHALLYVLLVAIPLSGWLLNSVAGQPLPWFGLFELPALADRNPDWRKPLDAAHVWLFWTLVALACVHAAAAAYHHWWLRDATVRRMLFARGRGG